MFRRLAALGVVVCVASACHGPAAPTPTPPTLIRPIHVDSVEVLVDGISASAHVQGVIGDGCTQLSAVITTRRGASVTVTILAQRPAEAICTQIAKLYDKVLRLPGEYRSGDYVLDVNGVVTSFSAP